MEWIIKPNPLRDVVCTWYLANMYFAQKPSDVGCLYQIDGFVVQCRYAKKKRILVCWDLLLIRSIILLEWLYLKTLALIFFSTISPAIFLMQDMRRSFSPRLIEICMETPCWCPSEWAPTWWPETNRNICHWVLLQKRTFTVVSLEEVQGNRIKLIPKQELFR